MSGPDEPQTPTTVEPKRDEQGRVVPNTGSLNPGGELRWVKKLRKRLQKGCPGAADYLISVIQGNETFVTVVGKDATEVTLPVMPKDRIAACKLLFEYTVPKPKQEVEVTGNASGGQMSEVARGLLSKLAGLDS